MSPELKSAHYCYCINAIDRNGDFGISSKRSKKTHKLFEFKRGATNNEKPIILSPVTVTYTNDNEITHFFLETDLFHFIHTHFSLASLQKNNKQWFLVNDTRKKKYKIARHARSIATIPEYLSVYSYPKLDRVNGDVWCGSGRPDPVWWERVRAGVEGDGVYGHFKFRPLSI